MVALNGHIELNLPNEEYHKIDAISKSRLSDASISMLKYFDSHIAPQTAEDEDETPAQKKNLTFGSALHCRILEPERYEEEYLIVPKVDKRTKQGKEDFAHYEDRCAAEGKTMILDKDAAKCEIIAKKIHEHPVAGKLIGASTLKETSIFWEDPVTGEKCKCRPDTILLGNGIILDTKSARGVEEFQIEGENWERRHHFSPAHYGMGVEIALGVVINAYIFIASEKVRPFDTQLYIFDDLSLQAGQQHVRSLINQISECKKTGIWPGRSPDIKTIGLPRYALSRYYGVGKETFRDQL